MTSARIASSVTFATIFLFALFNPQGWGFVEWLPPIIVLFATVLGVWEFNHLGKEAPPRPQLILSMIGAALILLDGYYYALEHVRIIIPFLTVATIAVGLPLRNVDVAAVAGKSVIAPIYVALPLALIMHIWRSNLDPAAEFPNRGAHYLLFLIIVSWSTDIGAYFAGRAFGKHKLAPTLSPGKTIEGSVGGVLLTMVIACVLKAFWNNIDEIFLWRDVLILGAAFAIIGPMGDLAESQMKRAAGKKDSGRTFTGHGGMLDIIDSLLFTAIVYYVYLFAVYPEVVGF